VVTGVDIPICLVILALGFVLELPELAYLVVPAFEPLALVCLVSLVCEPIGLVSVSICFPVSFGPLVLAISVVAALGWVCVAVLAFVVIGFRRGVIGFVAGRFGAV
jgi:hypothetical protein